MKKEQTSIRERIIFAAIACIEKKGVHSVTTRGIALEAGVNSAAINYYFGSKSKLITAAMERAMDNAISDFDILEIKSENPFAQAEYFFLNYFEGMINYPEITKAQLNNYLKSGRSGSKNWQNEFTERFHKTIKPFLKEKSDDTIRLIMLQLLSSLAFPSIFPSTFRKFTGLNLNEKENQKKYIDCLLSHYLKQ